jgi:hypothetical protein
MNQETKKKGLPTWAIVLIVLAVGGPVVLGIVSALAIYGVRKYIGNAKRAEATNVLAYWSRGMVACAEKDGLPLTSPRRARIAHRGRGKEVPICGERVVRSCFRMRRFCDEGTAILSISVAAGLSRRGHDGGTRRPRR